jgi:hypothetical protein
MAQAWYQGGLSVFDFTDSKNPVEIAFFDRGPYSATDLVTAGYWSTYWYNGHIYGSEIARGVDIFRLTPSAFLTQNEIDAAALVQFDEFNAQQQPKMSWPAVPVVARAYLDQLTRGVGISAARAAAVRRVLDSGDATTRATVAAELEADANTATGRDAERLRALADVLTNLGGQSRE